MEYVKRILIIFFIVIIAICILFLYFNLNSIKIKNINIGKEILAKNIKAKWSDILDLQSAESEEKYVNVGGFRAIGKIKIPKINLETYILEDTTDEALEISVTKLCGPKINTQGNFCIAGHNYLNSKMFGNIYKLEIGDLIYIVDNYERSVEYRVYNKYVTTPDDLDTLKSYDESFREITLITCTTGATKRLIVKAVAIYD